MGTLWTSMRIVRAGCLGILLFGLLAILGACVALGWGLSRVAAADPPLAEHDEPPRGLDVGLVIDQSDSLWTMGGTGSDPQGLRMLAARLFAARLAVERERPVRLAVVHFGSEARLALPLATLSGADASLEAGALGAPPPMGWTDIGAALAVAEAELFEGPRAAAATRKALVVFTDGLPQTPELGSPDALSEYLAVLERRVRRLQQRGTAVFTVLLRSAATDADPLLEQVYRPFWAQLAERGASPFYDLRAAADVAAAYHDIAARLGAGTARGAVLDQVVAGRVRVPVTVPAGWRRATFVALRGGGDLGITVAGPDGRPLDAWVGGPADPPPAGGGGQIQVLSVEDPPPGLWTVQADGQGAASVWLDYVPGLPPAPAPAVPSSGPPPAPADTLVPGPGWLALGALPLAALGSWVVVVRRRRAGGPCLDGTLRLLPGTTDAARRVWQLTDPRRRTLTLDLTPAGGGQPPGARDVGPLSLRLERRGGRTGPGETWLIPLGQVDGVRVNGRPAAGGARLTGWDDIEIGGRRLRYENLGERAQHDRQEAASRRT
jgi:hypothetical protein